VVIETNTHRGLAELSRQPLQPSLQPPFDSMDHHEMGSYHPHGIIWLGKPLSLLRNTQRVFVLEFLF